MGEIVWPLVGCRATDPLLGGFGWLEPINDGAGTVHCGVDLNAGAGAQADCGASIVAPCDMLIVKAIYGVQNGFGNHVWAVTDDNTFLHFCHLETIGITEGRVSKGSVFATCGRTNGWANGWPFCHQHFEVLRDRPIHWEFWPKGWARRAIEGLYRDPLEWLEQQAALPPPQEPDVTDAERDALNERISALEADQVRCNGLKSEFETYIRNAAYKQQTDRAARKAKVTPADFLIAKVG